MAEDLTDTEQETVSQNMEMELNHLIEKKVNDALAKLTPKKRKIDIEDQHDNESEENNECDDEEGWLTEDESDDEGEPMADEKIAEYIDAKLTTRIKGDKLKIKMARQKRPKNVQYARETNVNAEILNKLKRFTKMRDFKLKRIQGMATKAVIAAGRIAETVRCMQLADCPKRPQEEWGNMLYNDAFDAIAFAAQVSYLINMRRVSRFDYNLINTTVVIL